MAITEGSLPVGATDENLRTFEVNPGAGTVHIEAVASADPENTDDVQRVRTAGNLSSSDPGAVVRVPDGGDVALGAKADSAASSDTGTFGLIALFKRLLGLTPPLKGTWGYHAGTSGTLAMSGSKRVLEITAVAQGAAGTITINGGDTITLPYDADEGQSSAISIKPLANLVDPTIVFTGTDSYFVQYVT